MPVEVYVALTKESRLLKTGKVILDYKVKKASGSISSEAFVIIVQLWLDFF